MHRDAQAQTRGMRVRRVASSAVYLARTYAAALPQIVYGSTLALLVDPRGAQCFVHEVLSASALRRDDPVLGSKPIEELLPPAGDPCIPGPYHRTRHGGSERLLELATLAYLVRGIEPRLIFEIGTFVGRTTRVLAANAPPSCEVFTLDLPAHQTAHDPGVDLRGTPEAAKVRQLVGDSRTFDFRPWSGKADFVWVDGGHDRECVTSDTRTALELCRPGGWIAWHDYWHNAPWSPVTRCLRGLRARYPEIVHVRGTTIALLRRPE